NQIADAHGSLLKTDTLYNLLISGAVPAAVCRNGVMNLVLHPVEPLTLAGTFERGPPRAGRLQDPGGVAILSPTGGAMTRPEVRGGRGW
ncbi:hypothetical protein ACI4B7_27410, partial [Klebsiella pneumoniae]|uniref:hypothetical protein n=1 Tax=Klebsiella pneumoniae TaxID=573 RepID=UPI00385370D8